MAGLVTKITDRDVEAYINAIPSTSKQEDTREIIRLIESISGLKPNVWGNKKVPDFIIGFGRYTYQRKGDNEDLEWFHMGLAPRKSKITIYLNYDISKETELLSQLGKHKCGKGCLYINNLQDINIPILSRLIGKSKNAQWH